MTQGASAREATLEVEPAEQGREGWAAAVVQAKDSLFVRDAVASAKQQIGEHERGRVWEGKIQGRAGEIIACEARRGARDLNDHCSGNFPVYDLVDRHGFISVKTHLRRSDGELPLPSYAHDLRVAIGTTWRPREGLAAGKNGPDFAAERLWRLREDDPAAWVRLSRSLPSDAGTASNADKLAAVMEQHALLAVPADHVAPAREYVERVAQLHPDRYGLDSSGSESQRRLAAHELAQRIVPLKRGVTGDIIADQVAAATRRRR